MKYSRTLLLFAAFFGIILHADGQPTLKNYESSWKKVEDFVKKNLPKSALAEVKNIYQQAKKDNQDAQVIKALVRMTDLQEETREDNTLASIREMEKEITLNKEPAAAILKSFVASLYWSYYSSNRYKFYNRTATVDFKKDDIATWTAEDLQAKISGLYLSSLSNEKLLQQTKLQPYDAIIIKGNMRELRPTLYDILANSALAFLVNDELDINRPAYAFEIDQASAFDPAADFVTRKFETKDSLSLKQKALLIYQHLLAFHLKDSKPGALIDADLQRIQFVYQKSIHPDKEQLYYNSINHIANQYGNTPAASQAWFLVAAWYEQRAAQFNANGDTSHRFDRIRAREICEKLLAEKDSSEGKTNAYNLRAQLDRPELRFSVEKVNVPGQAFRTLVNYRNIGQIYLRVVKADEALKKQLSDEYGDKYWPSIIAAKSVRDWQQVLPQTNDLQNHAAEIKIDALPAGDYLLIAGTSKDFDNKKTLLGARLFYVSSISYVNNNGDFFVLNRDNGQPLNNATVQIWEQKYDYATSKNIRTKGGSYKTD
ncbi:MAG TPA: hypothetical protein VK644_00115, partial [Chitinophagaceae bacterium]|nr:hypothetical protein [Chitinophagaceae bacterium]